MNGYSLIISIAMLLITINNLISIIRIAKTTNRMLKNWEERRKEESK